MKFKDRLLRLGFACYADYLDSGHWQSFRGRYRKSASQLTCKVCDDPRIELHHTTYERLGHERMTDVVPLCRSHHEQVHKLLKANNWFVNKTDAALLAIAPQSEEARRVEEIARKLAIIFTRSDAAQLRPRIQSEYSRFMAKLRRDGQTLPKAALRYRKRKAK